MSVKNKSKKWKKKDDKVLLEMFYDDKSYGEIAMELKRTYQSVAQRLHKLRNEGVEIKKRTEDRNEDEVNRIIKGMDERRLEMQLQSTEIHKQIVGDGKGREWVDWVKKFEKKIDDLRDNAWDTETKKEFLNGFVETIHVKQIDKRLVNLLISFKIPFVNDAIRYKGYSQKPKKYDVISGASDIELEVNFIEKKLLKINAV